MGLQSMLFLIMCTTSIYSILALPLELNTNANDVTTFRLVKRFYPIKAIPYEKKRYFIPRDLAIRRIPFVATKKRHVLSQVEPDVYGADPSDFVIHFGKRGYYDPGEELALNFGKRRRR